MEGISLGISFLVMILISPKGIKLLHQLKFGQEAYHGRNLVFDCH